MNKKIPPWWEKTRIEPQQVGSIIEQWLRSKKLVYNWKLFRLGATWYQICDPKMLQHTKIENFRNHILEVIVDSPSFHFELNFSKKKILQKLQQRCPEIYISDIRFIIGDIHCE